MTELSVIFPVHNEAEGIESFLADALSTIRKLNVSFEIICVENGSTDGSLAILKSISKKIKDIRVIRSPKGWGNAVRAGIAQARGKLTVYMVSDYQVDPKYIAHIYHAYRNSQLDGSGYRLVKVRRTNRENTTRLVNSRTYNLLASLMFGVPSRDINATPKVAETALLRRLNLTSDNIAIDLELLLKLQSEGLAWQEIPVPSMRRSSGRSTTNMKAVWEMISHMIGFRYGIIRKRTPSVTAGK
ncbi:hypothetical protein A2Z33_03895 [Candidatus Gottesmanbacteria bacterium RBG_16_52_11]|uniref:Glycosyltransferase 2-like domain-containing protein n=1 Tax=Candidatus Gottesmanbacteria bacterium RBG_16_52_11 TaxID=1798374 RepID=A0A1F5YVZ4_9BACT|nr:MAG: hypothetical protein A2Z33_03895 [Candidatus Gottesmanbacteria bacterium RBG_16_52_11]